jgi:hypothetical protein
MDNSSNDYDSCLDEGKFKNELCIDKEKKHDEEPLADNINKYKQSPKLKEMMKSIIIKN